MDLPIHIQGHPVVVRTLSEATESSIESVKSGETKTSGYNT